MEKEELEKIVVGILSATEKGELDTLVDRLVDSVGYGEHSITVGGKKYIVKIQKVEHRLIGVALARMALGLYQEVKFGNRASVAIAPLLRTQGKLLYIFHARE